MAPDGAGTLGMLTPKARGTLSERLFEALSARPTDSPRSLRDPAESRDDEQVALWALYELHHRGFEDVDDELEWDPRPAGAAPAAGDGVRGPAP